MWSEKDNDFTTYFCAKLGKMPVRFTDTLHPNCPLNIYEELSTKTIDGVETRVQVPPEQISDAIKALSKDLFMCVFCQNTSQTRTPYCSSCGAVAVENNINTFTASYGGTLSPAYNKLKQTLYVNRESARWEQAKKIPLEEAWEKYTALYLENTEQFVDCPTRLSNMIKDSGLKPSEIRLYATRLRSLKLDASDIVKDACFSQELHEDACDSCDLETLHRLLNLWCLAETGTGTYFPDFSIGVTYDAGQKT